MIYKTIMCTQTNSYLCVLGKAWTHQINSLTITDKDFLIGELFSCCITKFTPAESRTIKFVVGFGFLFIFCSASVEGKSEQELANVLSANGIKNLVYMGVHENMCVCAR